MTLAPIISSISIKLKEIEKNPNFEGALNIAKEIAYLLQGNNEGDFKILNVTRHGDKVSGWFNMVPGVDIPASYHFQMTLPVDFKVYWLQKSGKQRIAGCVNFTENYEDDPSLFFDKNIGVDIIIPNIPNKIQIVLSSGYKLRTLELQGDLSVTQIEILQKWIQNFSGLNQKTIHEILWESFNLKSLNQKFYQGIAKRFTEIVQHMVLQGENENEVKHFVNRLIGRIIFIWFLRKKNIINESYGYFDVEGIDADKYYYEKLSPLFFETLNKPVDERNHLDRSTPYLNGGLFEARGIDKKSNLSFLKVFFKDLYSFLSEYNFTTDESTSSFEQVAIDPEMLGRIFENLLAEQVTETGEQARKAKGAFYTPREIVDYMCTNSLKTYLTGAIEKTELKDSDKEKIIKHLFDDSDAQFALYKKNESYDSITKNRGVIISALDSITILDPACGSGAFPMGMMQAIIRVYERVLTEAKFDPVEIKLGIIERSIFGVDIEPMAVEISRLRVWLSIIVDEANDSSKIKPLPNLDFKFVCANSLIPLTTHKQGSFGIDLSNEDRMQEIRYEYFKTNSKTKKEKLRKEFEEIIGAGKESFDTSEYTKQLRSYHPFDPENSCDFFDPKFMFGIEKGFDLVIGNPPYVNSKKIEKNIRKTYWNIYKDILFGDMDLYELFIKFGIDNIKINGTLAFITSNSYLTNGSFTLLRKFILNNTKIISIHDFPHRFFPFENVNTETSIIILKKDSEKTNSQIVNVCVCSKTKKKIDLSNFTSIKIPSLDDNNGFFLDLSSISLGIIDRFKNKLIDFDKLFLVSNPSSLDRKERYPETSKMKYLKCVFNDLEINNDFELKLISEPCVTGDKILRYKLHGDKIYTNIKWKDEGKEKSINDKTYNLMKCNKLIGQRITGQAKWRIVFTYDDSGLITMPSVNFITLKENNGYDQEVLKILLAVLNSKLYNYLYKNFFSENNTNITSDVFSLIPIPNDIFTKENQIKLSSLVEEIINIDISNTEEIDQKINIIIYKIYKLTFEEVLIIDPEFPISKEDYEKLNY